MKYVIARIQKEAKTNIFINKKNFPEHFYLKILKWKQEKQKILILSKFL